MEKSLRRKEYKILLRLLYEKRMATGLKQVEMARKLGVHQSFISKTENGERRLDLIELADFCNALGTNLVEFTSEFHKEILRKK